MAVCDTYNGAVRRIADGEVTTLATGLAEPSAAYVDGDVLVVVESTAHRLTAVPLGAHARADGFAHTTQRPVTEVGAGVELVVEFTPPPGQKVDDRFGPPSQLVVSATPPQLIREGEGRGTDLVRRLVLDPAVGDGVLHVAARAASCDEDLGRGCCLPPPPPGLGCPGACRPRRPRQVDAPARRRLTLRRRPVRLLLLGLCGGSGSPGGIDPPQRASSNVPAPASDPPRPTVVG